MQFDKVLIVDDELVIRKALEEQLHHNRYAVAAVSSLADAQAILSKDNFDLVFLDAAKGQYPTYFPQIKRLLSNGGIFISDNVLFNGYVAKGAPDRHRNKTIVVRLDEYLKMLESDTDFKTVLLPISDGVTLSIKK